MEGERVNLGSSLLVPCVQELAKEHKSTIPSRYIRPELFIPNGASLCQEVPIIDMNRLLHPDSTDSELSKLHFACKEWGFFQLVNHDVSSTLMEKMKSEIDDFFNLPMEEKKKLWQSPGEVEGFGQAFVVSENQKLDWGDLFFIITLPIHHRKPHLFPQLPLPLRDTLEKYSLALENLAMEILGQMAKALNMKEEEMKGFFEDGHQAVRMNYYPPCPQPDQVIGLTPHSDATGLTILLQVNEVEGLQIKKDGKWVSVKPLPGAFIINIGDILEMITNGTYRSIEHRATVNSDKERLSIATFYAPKYGVEIAPAKSLITQNSPPKFKRVTVKEFFEGLFARELHEKSYLDTYRL